MKLANVVLCVALAIEFSLCSSSSSICSMLLPSKSMKYKCGSHFYCTPGKEEVLNGYCLTYNALDEGFYGGRCPFSYKGSNSNRILYELPRDHSELNDTLCGPYNREGLLCSKCIPGYGPAVHSLSLKCADCSKLSTGCAILIYLLIQLVPIVLLFISIVMFRFSVTSGPLLGYVMFCHFYMSKLWSHFHVYDYLNSNVSGLLWFLLHVELVLCECWNLNFLRPIIPPFCIHDKLTDLHILMLTLLSTLFPILLMFISCIFIKLQKGRRESHNICINLTSSNCIFHAFATLILLSSTTNVYVCSAMLREVELHHYSSNGTSPPWKASYFDPNLHDLSVLPYFFIALFFSSILVVLPALLLCIYPTWIYTSFSRYISSRKRLAITAFVEALHCSFKDGLNGTKDYRAFAGAILFIVPGYSSISYLTYAATNGGYEKNVILMGSLYITSLAIAYIRPFKSTIASISYSYHLIMAGVIVSVYYLWECDQSTGIEKLEFTFIIIPLLSHLFVFCWVIYKLHNKVKDKFKQYVTQSFIFVYKHVC